MSRSPIPRHRALLAGFCLAGALSAQAATQEEILDAALVSGDSSQLTDSHLVALRLQQAGYDVDFASPWARGHAGDYDLDELFAWMDAIGHKN